MAENEQLQQTPLPAVPLPGITGNPPLPLGRPVIINKPTPGERAVLEQVGWKVGEPVPENLAEHLAAIAEEALREGTDTSQLPPPAVKGPLQMPQVIDVERLPPEKQQKIRRLLEEVKQQQRQQPVERPAVFHSNSVQQAVEAVSAGKVRTIDVGPERPAVQSPPAPDATGSVPGQAECPHCGWRLSNQDPVQPTEIDKQQFVQAVLGGIPFEKSYALLDGQMEIRVRELRPDELELCYNQVFLDHKKGELDTLSDQIEQLSRYRTVLQLLALRFGSVPKTMPRTISEWKELLQWDGGDETPLPGINKYVSGSLLATESQLRMVTSIVHEFNRLVVKLEANATNPDFWRGTRPAK